MKIQSSEADIQSTAKLKARLSANSNATRDFDEWCVRQFPELPIPARILDLGAGTGKQVNLFGPLLSPSSEILALDMEPDSLQVLAASYDGSASLRTIEGSFDELDSIDELNSESLDLIYSSYALYYSLDLHRVVGSAHDLLKPGGVFWVIMPCVGTNREFLEILRPLYEVDPFMDYVFDEFHHDVTEAAERRAFSAFKPALLHNKIRFPDSDSFMSYLSNSLFYQEGYDDEIREAVSQRCTENGRFEVSKNIISLQFRK
jgi:SAM-dependent methyltransferase